MTFLTRVTSQKGKNVIAGLETLPDGKTIFRNYFVEFGNEAITDRMIDSVMQRHGDVYFALGTFKMDEEDHKFNRKQRNVIELKSFWLDIDCGDKKYQKALARGKIDVYQTRELGLAALVSFLQKTGLPHPTLLVSSGEGWHVYWELVEPVNVTQWRFTANMLKGVCTHFGLFDDKSRTADPASVLRVPGTTHRSSGRTVSIVKDTGMAVKYEDFHAALSALQVFVPQTPLVQGLALGETPEWAKGTESSMPTDDLEIERKFGAIIARQKLEGSGCKQLYQMYVDQENVSQPMWAAGLSIIKFCTDKDEWAVKFSENYSKYNYDETMKTMECFQGPRTCAWFKEHNPEGCAGCPHLRNLVNNPRATPLSLGKDFERAPTVIAAPLAVHTEDGVQSSTEVEQFVIPSYPYPYYRDPLAGGVWTKDDSAIDEDGNPLAKCVYEYDFYLYDRIGENEADGSPKYWARLHTPHDGVLEFELAASEIVAKGQKLIEALANKHIILTDQQAKEMSVYLKLLAAKHQRERPMSHAPKQLGWTDRGTFVLGRTEYTKAGPRPAPVSGTIIARMFELACKRRIDAPSRLERWRQVIKGLYGAPDAGMYRLVLAAGFGAVLRSRYALERGGVFNLFSEESGVGKTTLTRALMSIYGNPDSFVFQAKHGTTNVAFFETISYLNSLPLVNDEIGQLNAHEMMEFIHTCTSGKSKLRGSGQTNDVRPTLPGWRSFVFSSSNVSVWNRISETRIENEAYLMRVAELPIRKLKQSEDKTYGDQLVRELGELHGVCAPILIDYIVKNDTYLKGRWLDLNAWLSKEADLHSRYRFWADMFTSAVIGAEVGAHLGLFPFDPEKIKTASVAMLKILKLRAAGVVLSDKDILSEFFNSNIDVMLVTSTSSSAFPILQPRKTVGIRIEPDTKMVYISVQAIVEFAKAKGFDRSRIEGVLELAGAFRDEKDLFAGTTMGLINQTTRVWAIDMTTEKAQKLFNLEAYVEHIKRLEDAATKDVGNNKQSVK